MKLGGLSMVYFQKRCDYLHKSRYCECEKSSDPIPLVDQNASRETLASKQTIAQNG